MMQTRAFSSAAVADGDLPHQKANTSAYGVTAAAQGEPEMIMQETGEADSQ